MKEVCLGLALMTSFSAYATAQEPVASTASTPSVVTGITDREISGHLHFLASDLMRGRDTASPEIFIAGEYIATQLRAAGAEPAGDIVKDQATYFAAFPLTVTTPRVEGTGLTLIVERNGATREIPCTLNEEFVVLPRGVEPGTIEAPVVLARQRPADHQGSFDALEGLDVKDRFVLVVDTTPPATGGQRRFGGGGALSLLREQVKQGGGLGVIGVHPFGEKLRPFSESMAFTKTMFDRPSMTLGKPGDSDVPLIYLEDAPRDELDAALHVSGENMKAGPVEGMRARFAFAASIEEKSDRNVVGMFPGSDPEKSKEIVIFSAHYDHVGVGEDGQIFNGSDDNASGTSALLEVAEAMGEGPKPARTVAFLWVSGEEKGLWGSRWFADHMTFPEGYKVVADINMDMVSRNDPRKIGITPSKGHPARSTLGPMAEEACAAEGVEPVYDADQFFGRTDSFNFAAKGIPVVFFFSGLHDDYHRPTDDVEKADFGKAARIARVAYRLAWEIAQNDEAPTKVEPDAEAAKTAGDSNR
jgi:Peptidase family M28